MVTSSRMVLISSKVSRSVSKQADGHINLPGYVRSNSDQDCLPHWIQEEANEEDEKQVDDISLKETLRPQLQMSTEADVNNRNETEETL